MLGKYILRVTAGPSYDPDNHVEVGVNTPTPVKINHKDMDIELNVRVKDYSGLPYDSPYTSPYFSTEPHAANDDRYSITFRFTPKPPCGDSNVAADISDQTTVVPREKGISATDLQFGNDFDSPVRDKLPPGFSYAMNIVKWWIDPGLDGDPYADTPYLYGPALSSINLIYVGKGEYNEAKGGLWFEEGGDKDGNAWRSSMAAPSTGKARMKWALKQENKETWVWEWGRTYGADFFNAYLDFAEFVLRLPGYDFPLMNYLDDGTSEQRSHHLRYVLRNKATGNTYMVVVFTLHRLEDVNEDGTLKPVPQADERPGDSNPSRTTDENEKEEHNSSCTQVFPPYSNSKESAGKLQMQAEPEEDDAVD